MMKNLFNKIIRKALDFLRWVWGECRDWRTFLLLAIVCITIGTPVWGGYILFFLFGWKWAFAMATAALAFWWIPGVPFFTVSVTVTLAIKKLAQTLAARAGKKRLPANSETQSSETKPQNHATQDDRHDTPPSEKS